MYTIEATVTTTTSARSTSTTHTLHAANQQAVMAALAQTLGLLLANCSTAAQYPTSVAVGVRGGNMLPGCWAATDQGPGGWQVVCPGGTLADGTGTHCYPCPASAAAGLVAQAVAWAGDIDA